MENQDLHPITILKLKKIHNCGKCYKKLQKKLSKIDGVYAVSIDEEKNLAIIRGRVNPSVLIKAIEELEFTAELISYEKEPKEKRESSKDQKGKGRGWWKGKESKQKDEEEEHIIEGYEPQRIDPEVCRDPYCKQHKRRPIITNRVPTRDNENHPHHTGMGFFPGGHHFYQTDRLQYCDYPPPEMTAPSAAYGGFYSGRAVRPRGFTFYGNGNPRECNTM